MEIRQLEYFLAVARELSFTRAAQALHVTVPPLTRGVKALERELDVSLFDRSTHHVALTDAGSRLVPLADSIVSAVAALPARLHHPDGPETVRLSVPVALNHRVRHGTSDVLARLTRTRALAVSQIRSKDATAALLAHRVDLALTHVEPGERAIAFVPVDEEDLGVLVDTAHLPDGADSVRVTDLSGFSYVHGPTSWQIEEMRRAQAVLFSAGVADSRERCEDLAGMLLALEGARAVTLQSLDSDQRPTLQGSRLRVLPVADQPMSVRTFLAWRAGDDTVRDVRDALLEGLADRR